MVARRAMIRRETLKLYRRKTRMGEHLFVLVKYFVDKALSSAQLRGGVGFALHEIFLLINI